MAKRRPSGDGMVRKREDGRWEGRIVVGHKKNGTPIFQHAYAHTQKELTEKLHQNIERYQDVELTEDSRMTLGEWLDRWLTDYKENTVRPGTLAGYRSYIENYIKPQLGGKQVSLVTSQDVQKLYRKLKENGRVKEHPRFGSALSDTTINRLHAIFHQAMEDALHAHIIAKNPTVGATVPKASHAPKRVLTDKELDTFLDAVREDKIWGDFFYVELTTGLRRGEICGLMWQDFDVWNGSCKCAAPFITESWGSICWARPRPAAVNAPSSCPAARRKFCAAEKRMQSRNGSSQTLSDRSCRCLRTAPTRT